MSLEKELRSRIDEHNARSNDLDEDIEEFNQLVAEYNRKLKMKERLAAVLEGIDNGDIQLDVVGETPKEVFAGNVEYLTDNGWRIWVFCDCNEWDYIDKAIAPDGERFEFEDGVDYYPEDLERWHWG